MGITPSAAFGWTSTRRTLPLSLLALASVAIALDLVAVFVTPASVVTGTDLGFDTLPAVAIKHEAGSTLTTRSTDSWASRLMSMHISTRSRLGWFASCKLLVPRGATHSLQITGFGILENLIRGCLTTIPRRV